MMETAPILRLQPSQIAQLISYCVVYRSSLWQSCLPTLHRNQALRNTQALQAKLEQAQERQEQGAAEIPLALTDAEKQTLRQLLSGLLQYYAAARPSEARTQQLSELSGFRLLLERMSR